MIKRVIFSTVLIISALVLPWWIGVLLSLAGLFYFNNLYEVFVVGLILDSIYGSQLVLLNIEYTMTLFAIVIFLATTALKKRLFMY